MARNAQIAEEARKRNRTEFEKECEPLRKLIQNQFSQGKSPQDSSVLHQALQNWNLKKPSYSYLNKDFHNDLAAKSAVERFESVSIDISGLLPSVPFWTFGKHRKQLQKQRTEVKQALESALQSLKKDLGKVFALLPPFAADQLKLLFHNKQRFTMVTHHFMDATDYKSADTWKKISVAIEKTPDALQALTKAIHHAMHLLVVSNR